MKAMLNQDIIRKTTRLTRAGQLVEATALLQRMLCGASAPDAPSRTGGRIALTGREPLIIDAKANPVESPPHNRACSGRYWIAKRGAPGSDCEV